MGHSVGISDSYYRPTEHELLDDYLKAVDHLTISGESKLYQEIDKLKREHEEDSLQQDAIGLLSDQLIKLSAEVQELKKASHRPKTSTSTDSVLRSA